VIAGIVGDEGMRRGPIPIALQIAGFETHDLSTAEQAEHRIRSRDPRGWVLVIDAESLERRESGGRLTWSSFLSRRPALSVVVVAYGEAAAGVRDAAWGWNRILLEDPFDAAAVVAAAERVSRAIPPRVRSRPAVREAG
jgi:hypothetical protein